MSEEPDLLIPAIEIVLDQTRQTADDRDAGHEGATCHGLHARRLGTRSQK